MLLGSSPKLPETIDTYLSSAFTRRQKKLTIAVTSLPLQVSSSLVFHDVVCPPLGWDLPVPCMRYLQRLYCASLVASLSQTNSCHRAQWNAQSSNEFQCIWSKTTSVAWRCRVLPRFVLVQMGLVSRFPERHRKTLSEPQRTFHPIIDLKTSHRQECRCLQASIAH
jgi:hypothetical protein